MSWVNATGNACEHPTLNEYLKQGWTISHIDSILAGKWNDYGVIYTVVLTKLE